jgi:hypothetical protein
LNNNYYCVPLTMNQFGGDFRDTDYNFISMYVSACDPTTPKCNKALSNAFNVGSQALYLDIYYPQIFYNPNLYDGAFKVSHVSVTDKYQYGAVIDRDIFLKQSVFNDDRGWLFSDINKTPAMSVNNSQVTRGTKPTTDLILYRNSVYLSGYYEEYSRTYQKIQEVVAVVGGFLGICRIFLRLLLYSYIKYIKSEYLLNDLIKWKKGGNGEELLSSPKRGVKTLIKDISHMPSINKYMEGISNSIKEEEKDCSQIDLTNKVISSLKHIEPSNKIVPKNKFINQNGIKFQLTISEILKKTICLRCLRGRQKKRVETFDMVYNYIKDILDISRYFDLIIEFKKLKAALLSKTQKTCFNFHERPTIVIKDDMDDKALREIENVLYDISNTSYDERMKLVEYFAYKIYNKTANNVDHKLLEQLDNETTSLIAKRLEEIKMSVANGKAPIFDQTLLSNEEEMN